MICIAAVLPVSHSPKVAVPCPVHDIPLQPEAASSNAKYQQWHGTAWTTPSVPRAAGSSSDPPLSGTAPPAAAGLAPGAHLRCGHDMRSLREECQVCKDYVDYKDERALPGAAGHPLHASAPLGAAPPGAAPLDMLDMLAISMAEPDELLVMLLPMSASAQLKVAQSFAMSNEWQTVHLLVENFAPICEEQAGLLSMAAVMAWRCSPLEICVSVFGFCLLFVVQFHYLAVSHHSHHYLAVSHHYLTIISPLSHHYLPYH